MLAHLKGRCLPKLFRKMSSVAHCDEEIESSPSLIELADEAERGPKSTFRTPMLWENFKGNLHTGSVQSFDGFRVNVQKTVNMNTAVNHLYSSLVPFAT
jgi:hypothetical protein